MEKRIEKTPPHRGIWIVVALLALLFVVFIVASVQISSAFEGSGIQVSTGTPVGVVEINQVIQQSDEILAQIHKLANDDGIRALVIRINSPGGAVGASQEIREAIMSVDKPVAISMSNVAASGGLYIAMTGDRVFANAGTITGSIGVISQVMQGSELVAFLKLKVHTIKTGKYKDSGSPFREFTEEDRALFQELGQNILDQFIDDIASSRGLDRDAVVRIADGRVFTGLQAKEHGLVDEIGGLEAVRKYLAAELGVDTIHFVYREEEVSKLMKMLVDSGANAIGDQIKSAQSAGDTVQTLYAP